MTGVQTCALPIFKFNMLPDTSGAIGGTLLSYPNIVQVTASNGSSGYWTYLFKPAVVESMQVNFAPQGQASFFGTTNAPTAVEIRLNLHEIEFFLQRDYGTPTNSPFSSLAAAIQQNSQSSLPTDQNGNPAYNPNPNLG